MKAEFDSKKVLKLLNRAIVELEKCNSSHNSQTQQAVSPKDSQSFDAQNTDEWFHRLSDQEKATLKSIAKSGMMNLAKETIGHVQSVRSSCGRPEYRKVLEESGKLFNATKNLEKRASIRSDISAEHRQLSNMAQAAYRFFSHIKTAKNPIPKDSYGAHIGF